MSGKLVEYPFDTLKVRLQIGPYEGALHCVRTVIREEGIMAFYRGLSTPLIGSGMEVSTLFFGWGDPTFVNHTDRATVLVSA